MRLALAAAAGALLIAPPSATVTAPAIPRYDHVVVVIFENTNYSTVKGSSNAPYLNQLASQGALFTDSYGVTHPSQPNYLALFSGSQQGVTNDSCPKDFSAANLGQQLLDAGLTFKAYSEGLPSAGSTTCSSGRYVRKHAPWVDFPTVKGSGYHVPYSQFPTDFGKLPTVSFVIPDMCDDMHDCSTKTGDTWLKNNLDAYAQWAKSHNSLLIQTFDEDNFTSVNKIFTTFVGAHVKAGYESSGQINHYTVLRTIEEMYGLPALGNAKNKSPITDVWTTGSAFAVAPPGDQSGATGKAVSLQLSATGGTTPYTWSATGLPAGLSISGSGVISGTPTTAGTSSVTATAKDASGATASATFSWRVSATGTTVFADDFESDKGWTVSGNASTGAWERGKAEQTVSDSNQPMQLTCSTNCLVTGAAAGSSQGADDVDGGATTIDSPEIRVPAGATLSFTYSFAAGANAGSDDHLRVSVAGGSTLFDKAGSGAEQSGAWQQASVDLSAYAGKTIRLRVEAADNGTASLVEAQLDDLTVTAG
ncbi:alkaline phosphatase family protein [Nonomuraea sediminis]|uniref:alkaline phosphatase family protein n=1 Tax=Nonomuraea sediminis TaxID=2835864 RepID=UPI001BDCCC4F|nr:alkaline phosphatase family protein [Nonomuraea sediminis]